MWVLGDADKWEFLNSFNLLFVFQVGNCLTSGSREERRRAFCPGMLQDSAALILLSCAVMFHREQLAESLAGWILANNFSSDSCWLFKSLTRLQKSHLGYVACCHVKSQWGYSSQNADLGVPSAVLRNKYQKQRVSWCKEGGWEGGKPHNPFVTKHEF